jgi:hypothetical protein
MASRFIELLAICEPILTVFWLFKAIEHGITGTVENQDWTPNKIAACILKAFITKQQFIGGVISAVWYTNSNV